jgi:two-component system response regulator FixJ
LTNGFFFFNQKAKGRTHNCELWHRPWIKSGRPRLKSRNTNQINIRSIPTDMSLIDISSNELFIVDDDATVSDLLSMAFTVEGYHVTRFGDGSSFIASARTRTPACVLLDLFMPAKSGLDILKELDARNYSAPIFIMSGGGDIPTAVEAIKNGAYDFLEKQIGADAMVARVRQTIECWSPGRNRESSGEPLSQSFAPCGRLTQRERDVLNQVVAAASSKEAARNLGISRRTVEIHRLHIMKKLGAKNAVDLVRMVLSNGRSL